MARNKINEEMKELNEIIGLSIECDDFLDKKKRYIFPITMKDFSSFMDNIAMVNFEALWTNFMNEDSEKATEEVLKMSFKENDIDDLIENINARNFPNIMKSIMDINGIKIDGEKNDDPN